MGVGHHYCPLRRSILQPRDVTRSSNCGRRAKLLRSTLAAIDAPAANARNLAQLIAGHARTADCS